MSTDISDISTNIYIYMCVLHRQQSDTESLRVLGENSLSSTIYKSKLLNRSPRNMYLFIFPRVKRKGLLNSSEKEAQ